MTDSNFDKAFATNIIYVATIDVDSHRDCVKIGKASTTKKNPTHADFVEAARERTDSYSKTLGIKVTLAHVEDAVRADVNGSLESFMDHDVHNVLKRSGVKKKHFGTGANEWYQCSVETAKRAIAAVKARQTTLLPKKTDSWEPIELRPIQEDAINKTLGRFENHKTMLWNAKMRFGKTVTAYALIKRLNLRRTLIITHRPVVINGWHEDFYKVFGDRLNQFDFGSKTLGTQFDELEKNVETENLHYIYFASIQDLRGSAEVGGTFDKNNKIFTTPWDMLIIDEAHEGTLTTRGEKVAEALIKPNTYVLRLSGTPYKLMEDISEDELFTWDYIMEQRAKTQWDIDHPDEPNPYASLPTINIYTYDLGRLMDLTEVEGMAFNFREFFRTDGDYERFVHEADVRRFLQLLYSDEHGNLYPFSCQEYRETFRHTLWKVPGVKEARALSRLMNEIDFYRENFKIVNVAGDGDEEEEREEALAKLNNAITHNPETTKTITLSCGRLTTGVTVPAWTGVFMLSGTANTAATSYMQTIFRVQSPGNIGGRMKEQCYVFDFAPDRTLQVITEVNQLQNIRKNGTTQSDRERLKDFLNFCPVIAMDGSQFKKYEVETMFQQLKRVFIEIVVQKGFDDEFIYNKANLKNLSPEEQKMFEKLRSIINKTNALEKPKGLKLNESGLTNEEYEKAEKAQEKEKKERTPEEEKLLELLKEQKKNQKAAISILRGISVRMPLLVYGAKLTNETEELTLDNFINIVDDESWTVFMPKGVTKEMFLQFKKYFDQDVFAASAIRYRQLAREADDYNIEDRIDHISTILSCFRNPDKETVLTPWRVVNMHLGDTLGGYVFYNEDFEEPALAVPRFVDQGRVTTDVFACDTKILEINSKTGLYPLYAAYTVYRVRRKEWEKHHSARLSYSEQQCLWANVLKENIFVICMSPLAVEITKRTLAGFHDVEVNAVYYKDLITEAKLNPQKVIATILNAKEFWKINNIEEMKFNAVVGNPPYQVLNAGNGTGADPVYHLFIDLSKTLGTISTLIHPARFLFNAGKTPKEWNDKILSDVHFKVVKYFETSKAVFDNVDIKGGVAITMSDKTKTFKKIGLFSPHKELTSIVERVTMTDGFTSFSDIVYPRDLYKLTEELYKENIWAEGRQSDGHRYDVGSGVFSVFPELFFDEKPLDTEEYSQIYGREDTTRVNKWIKRKYLKVPDNFESYKVFIPKSNGSGTLGETLSNPIVGLPNVGHTVTFLSIGKFDNAIETEAVLKYIKTKFARTLLGSLKVTQDNPKDTWANIPLQDFTPSSDIDWSNPIPEIDQQLYKKYGLTPEEQSFIEKMIKPME